MQEKDPLLLLKKNLHTRCSLYTSLILVLSKLYMASRRKVEEITLWLMMT